MGTRKHRHGHLGARRRRTRPKEKSTAPRGTGLTVLKTPRELLRNVTMRPRMLCLAPTTRRTKSALDDLTQSFADKTHALFKTPEPEKEEKLRRARADLKSSLQNLKSYGGDVIDDVTSKFK